MNKVINMLFCMAYLMNPYTYDMKGIRNISNFKQFNFFFGLHRPVAKDRP